MIVARADQERLDQGKQTKHVHTPEGIWPLKPSVPGVDVSNKGAVEVEDGGDVPGVTGQRASKETVFVVDEIVDDHFNDLQREPGGRGYGCRKTPRARSPDPGGTSVPNSLNE